MHYWTELYPDFLVPWDLAHYYPPYGDFDPDLPSPADLIILPWQDEVPRWAWAAWAAAAAADKPLKLRPDLAVTIGWKKYDVARYKNLVPQWRRTLTELADDIENVEDQVSTIIWLVQLIGKKFIPIPPGVFAAADDLKRSLDAADDILNSRPLTRSSKAELRDRKRETDRKIRASRSRLAKIIDWLQKNQGNMLEAAQATGTWFDFGIVLGPIFGYIEEGIWGLAEKTLDNYLIAAEAFLPGYTEDFHRNAQELDEQVQLALTDTFEYIFDQAEADEEWQAYFGT